MLCSAMEMLRIVVEIKKILYVLVPLEKRCLNGATGEKYQGQPSTHINAQCSTKGNAAHFRPHSALSRQTCSPRTPEYTPTSFGNCLFRKKIDGTLTYRFHAGPINLTSRNSLTSFSLKRFKIVVLLRKIMQWERLE